MKLDELRKKHPRLTFESFETHKTQDGLQMRFSLTLEPDISFSPELFFPAAGAIDQALVDHFVFHLGLVECMSYWKASCPRELLVKAGSLNQDQRAWWKDLFLNGLGEFFYKNDIDFTRENFLNITSLGPEIPPSHLPDPLKRDLVLVGGGKDSAATLELLKNSGRPTRALTLNPTRAALDTIKIAGLTDPIIIKRSIDPKLLELNNGGYLNGHTPFSAYLAFLGLFAAAVYGYENVIASNEASANEGNVLFHGVEINHQYSKSFTFEKQLREYAQKYLTGKHHYFSLLRPINELQISKIFSQLPQYFFSFRSCNAGAKTGTWCGRCAKCTFVYLSLFPFVPYEQMIAIFGADLFVKPEIIGFVKELVRLGERKPFECVGTKEEATLALAMSIKRYQSLGKEPPKALLQVEKEAGSVSDAVLTAWNGDHFVPEQYTKLLSANF